MIATLSCSSSTITTHLNVDWATCLTVQMSWSYERIHILISTEFCMHYSEPVHLDSPLLSVHEASQSVPEPDSESSTIVPKILF